MNKFILGTCIVFAFSVFTSAQVDRAALAEARQMRREMVKQHRLEQKAQENVGKSGQRSGLTVRTDAEVGEASSFNRTANFFGTATAGIVLVEPDCDPLIIGELGPDDRCLEVTDQAVTTTATFNDIGRITLPGRQADNIIYLIGNHNISSFLLNLDSSPVTGTVIYTPSVTIESVALNDPAALNPDGTPMNGSFTTTGMGTRLVSRTLSPGSFDSQAESYSRANTNGLSRTFWRAIGLPDAVIDELFRRPMTIRLNVRVSVRRVESGFFTFSTRLLAN